MENIIIEKLNKVKNLEDRRLLKEILSSTVLELSKHQSEINKLIEERVFSEIKQNESNYNIYFTINDKDSIDPLDETLFPMFNEDLDINPRKILEKENPVLKSIFINDTFQNIEKLLNLNKTFIGEIRTNINTYNISVSLRRNEKYLKEIEQLHKIFIVNNIRWKTINTSYLNKFIDVVLLERVEIPEEEEIENIEIFLGEYEEIAVENIIPLWNIKKESISCSTFPVPTIDKINYEHTIVLEEDYTYTGYLINNLNDEIVYVKHLGDEIIIVCPQEKASIWDVIKIIKPENKKLIGYPYKVISNATNENFINYYSLHNHSHIKTKAEIGRLLGSFDVSEYIEVVDTFVDFNKKDYKDDYYNMNYFFVDNSIVEEKKPVMLVTFKVLESDDYIISDYISFLLSNLQTYFPEYKCVGKKI